MVLQRLAAVGAAAILVLGAASCGDDADSSAPSSVAFEVTDDGPERAEMSVDNETVQAGVVEVTLRNEGDVPHDAQLFKVEGNHDGADVASQILENLDGATQPPWAMTAGGVAQLEPGETDSVTLLLKPGRYVVADTQERDDGAGRVTGGARGATAVFEVVGEADGKLPPTPARIVLDGMHFVPSGLELGRNRVTIVNEHTEPHQVVVYPPRPGIDRLGPSPQTPINSGNAWVPVDIPNERATVSLGPGQSMVTELTFTEGKSLLACFTYDWLGGRLHVANTEYSWVDVPDPDPSDAASSAPERPGADAQ